MERQLDFEFQPIPGVLPFPGPRSRPKGERSKVEAKGEVLPFPPANRVRMVREVARELDRLGSGEAELFWDRTLALLQSELDQPQDLAVKHLRQFREAVQDELNLLAAGPHSGRPSGGAA